MKLSKTNLLPVLITGSSRGIGAAIARSLSVAGFPLLLHGRKPSKELDTISSEVSSHGVRCATVPFDLSNTADIGPWVACEIRSALNRLNADGLSGLVNSAGVGCRGTLDKLAVDALQKAFAVNTLAPVFVTQSVSPLIRNGGAIVNIGSLASRSPFPEILGYSMTKGALDTFTATSAAYLSKRGGRVNTVAPGLVETDLHSKWRTGQKAERITNTDMFMHDPVSILSPEDVADCVSFLFSEKSIRITGQRLVVSGKYEYKEQCHE